PTHPLTPDVGGSPAPTLPIPILAALTLFGIVRRTVARFSHVCSGRPSARPSDGLKPVAYRDMKSAVMVSDVSDTTRLTLAVCVALVWAVHPLQTGAVTYIVQRAES